MAKKFTDEELTKLVTELNEKKDDNELSLDDLENVNGGYSVAENGDTITITLTDAEYDLVSQLAALPIAKTFIKAYGLDRNEFARVMTFPTEKGKKVLSLLALLPKM